MYPKEFIQYLVHFHCDRDYFECHEILEDYWKQIDFGNKQSIWVGLIQLAVSCYHHRRGNFNGAKKTLEKAIIIFSKENNELNDLGINKKLLLPLLHERMAIIIQKKAYSSFNLPIDAPLLLQQCKIMCRKSSGSWGSHSDMDKKEIIHRHLYSRNLSLGKQSSTEN